MNAFSPNYVSQIKTDDISSCLKKSRASTAKRGELREHETLSIRENAAGSIKVKQHAGQWPKGKPLVQPLGKFAQLTAAEICSRVIAIA